MDSFLNLILEAGELLRRLTLVSAKTLTNHLHPSRKVLSVIVQLLLE